MNDGDEFFGRLDAWVVARGRRIDQMFADVILDHFGDEAIERATRSCRLLQHARAFTIGRDGAFDGIDLPANALESVEQLRFFVRDMAHKWLYSMVVIYPTIV